MLALPPDRAPTPYYLEEGESSISLKARIPGKLGEEIPANICLFNKKGRGNYRANAEYVLRACNAFENCLDVLKYLWDARTSFDDSRANIPSIQSPELEAFIKSVGELLYPEGLPAPVKFEPRDVVVDIPVTAAKIKAWENQK